MSQDTQGRMGFRLARKDAAKRYGRKPDPPTEEREDMKFIKIGNRLVNLSQVTFVSRREDGAVDVHFQAPSENHGPACFNGTEADEVWRIVNEMAELFSTVRNAAQRHEDDGRGNTGPEASA